MLSKKAAIPAEELSGMLVYMIVAVIAVLLFYGCNISNAKKSSEQEKNMEQGIDAAKELNSFLEIPIGNNEDVYSMVQEAYGSKDFSGIDRMAKDFFGQKYSKWRLAISDESRNILYSYLAYEINTKEPAKSELQVPVFEMGNVKFLTISLEVYK